MSAFGCCLRNPSERGDGLRGAGELFEGQVEVVADWRIRREHRAEVSRRRRGFGPASRLASTSVLSVDAVSERVNLAGDLAANSRYSSRVRPDARQRVGNVGTVTSRFT